MPLPLLIPVALAGTALAGALFGVKKGVDAYQDKKLTDELRQEAEKIYDESQKSLEATRVKADEEFQKLGELQRRIVDRSLASYSELIDRLKILDSDTHGHAINSEILDGITPLQENIVTLQNSLGSIVGGSIAGAMAGFGAFGSAGLLATASTGTAISTLSGVAATNATLAWFGGGSLAAGGLGMAGGTMVLGGLVVGPALAVGSWFFAKCMEEKKIDAHIYLLQIRALCQEMSQESLAWHDIVYRTTQKAEMLKGLDEKLFDHISKIWRIVAKQGDEVAKWTTEEQKELKTMIQLAETTYAVINAPIMSDEDDLTCRLKHCQQKTQEILEEIQKRWGN